MLRSIVVAAAFVVMMAVGAAAQTGPIEADHVWARATPSGAKTAVVYLTLVNKGAADDRLVAVSTDVAGKADLHTTTTENGIARMRPVAALDLKPGSPTVLKPGGYHIMLTDLKRPLAVGQSFPLSLTFEKAGKIDVTVMVEKAGTTDPHAMPGMKM